MFVGVDAFDADGIAVWHQHPKVVEAAQGIGGPHPAEFKIGAVGVVDDQPGVLARQDCVGDRVFDIMFAGADDPEFPGGVVEFQHPGFGGDFGAGFDNEEALATAGANPHVEAFVFLVEHPNVFGRGGADLVTPHGVRPPGIVDAGVEKIIGTRPGDTVEHIVDHIVEEFPGLQVLNVEGEAFIPLGVGGIGQVATGIIYGGGAQGEKVVAFGQLVGVEQDFLVGQGTGFGHHRRHPILNNGHAGGNTV